MLTDVQLLALYREGLYSGELEPADYSPMRQMLAGLRAVEAAVRADQIEKDAAIANDNCGRGESAPAIRAQLPAIVSEPSTPEQPEGEN